MSIKKIMHKDRHGAQVSIEFGEGGPAAQLVEQFLGGMGVPAMQDIPQEHPGNPKGTDTVPAWLTPGEFVMNAEATRMFEPQIEEMNNAGRAVQRQQGGSIPEYKSYGGSIPEYYNDGGMAGSWLNDNVLDALLMTESGGDFNAVSPAGARGGYQIMPATAANPGYGVTPISSEDVLDPMKSREFARQYIMGIAKANPNATQQEVLQMYNAGPNRVKGANVGNPLTQETLDYPGKIEAQMAKMGGSYGVPEPQTEIESLTIPTTDAGVLTSLKSAQATLLNDDDGRLFPKYDPVVARAEQARLEAANKIERAKAEEEYNRKKLEGRAKTLSMFGMEPPPKNEDLEAQITDIDKQRVLGDISNAEAASMTKTLRDNEAINQIARDAAAAGDKKEVVDQVSELERRAKLLEEAGYTEDAEALRKEAAGLTSDGTEPEDDEATINALLAASEKAKKVTPEEDGDVGDGDTKEPTAWGKVIDFFKEGFGTILDKGALSEAATLYLGSRALGYNHEGSLNFVAKRYGKGIEDKLAIANKAVGTYTPESITKYKDTGNLNDLTLIKTLTDQNKPVAFVVPETGELINLYTMKDEKGVTVIVNEKNEPVNTRSWLTADEYRSRSSSNISKITPLLEGAKKKIKANNPDDEDFDADSLFNTAAVAQAISNHALSNKFNDAQVSKLTPYITTFIQKARSTGGDTYKDVNDMDLTEMAITQGIARRFEPNLFETGRKGEVDPVLWQTEIDLEFPDIDKEFNAREKALMFKTIYQYGYLQRTPKEIEEYRGKALEGSNGFLVYLKESSEEDRGKWKPKFNALLNNK